MRFYRYRVPDLIRPTRPDVRHFSLTLFLFLPICLFARIYYRLGGDAYVVPEAAARAKCGADGRATN